MTIDDTTPVLIGAGQFTERVGEPGYAALANYEIAAKAGKAALADACARAPVSGHVDVVAAVRTFEDSSAALGQPFGKSYNFPMSVARRLDIAPRLAVYDEVGGQSPQKMVAEFCGRIAKGEFSAVLIAGAENISTVTHLQKSCGSADWSEHIDEPVEDRHAGMKGIVTREMVNHGLVAAPTVYALCENGRRARLGMARGDYAREMGELFAPFTDVAAANPHSAVAQEPLTPKEIVAVSERNRMIADSYPLRLVAREKVNQGAAALIVSAAKARELGVPEERRVYLHGHASLAERMLIERQDPGASPAARMAAGAALEAAAIGVADIGHFDFYSCFPIAVSNVAVDHFGLAAADPRGLTVTGGLPYFGGPGNNYSLHAIAEMMGRLRDDPGSFGFVGANGGFLSKYAAGVYSTQPVPWREGDSARLQAEIDGWDAPAATDAPEGTGKIEAYTVTYGREGPALGIVLGRLDSGERFFANSPEAEVLARMIEEDPLGAPIEVTPGGETNRFVFA